MKYKVYYKSVGSDFFISKWFGTTYSTVFYVNGAINFTYKSMIFVIKTLRTRFKYKTIKIIIHET